MNCADRTKTARLQSLSDQRKCFWCELAVGDDGMMTFVNVITVAFLALLIGFVGNVGRAVQEKVAVQNAADATAYSTSVVMARGMNAVTATNHLMGEATAFIVLLDALGVPAANESSSSPNDETRNISTDIFRSMINAPCLELSDKPLLQKAEEVINKNGVPSHGGVVYDSTLMLRKQFIEMLELKNLANVILLAKAVPPVSAIALTIGLGIHITANLVILELVKEAYILNFADQKLLSRLKPARAVMQSVVLPALSAYADSVVGKPKPGSSGSRNGAGVLANAATQAVDRIRKSHGVTESAVYPLPDALRLPVVPEPPPTAAELVQTQNKILVGKTRSQWTGQDQPKGVGADIHNRIKEIKNSVDTFLAPLQKIIDAADNAKKNTFGASSIVTGPVLWQARQVVDDVKSHLLPAVPPANSEIGGVGYSKNPSIDRLHEIPWELESRSQWVRSTYPAVDSLRAPFRHLFQQHLPLSSASNFLMHWTNRFTLEDSWAIRSGNAASQLPSLLPVEVEQLKRFLAKLQHEVQLLRQEFDFKTNGPGALAAGIPINAEAYKKVSRTLHEIVSNPEINKLLHLLPDNLRKWIARVLNHENEILSLLPPSGGGDPDLAFFESEFDAMADDLARVEILDELLRLLEDILGQIEDILNLADSGPPHMYVMSDSTPDLKGIEIWTGNSILAEKRFTVLAVAHRKPRAADFGSKLFGIGSERGITATAQAMFYNANGRKMPAQPQPKSLIQPDTGWDTLNWKPPVQAPEWGDTAPTDSGGDILDLFQSSHAPDRPSQIQLNWQAKLTPVTQSRLSAARQKLPWNTLFGPEPSSGKNDKTLIHH